MIHPLTVKPQDEEDGEFLPENVTFAPKDVTPIDFTPKVDLHGLGYRGLNPLAALRGGPGAGHINLFTMDSDRTNSLFGEDRKGQRRRGGVAGQVCMDTCVSRCFVQLVRFVTCILFVIVGETLSDCCVSSNSRDNTV